MSAKFVGAGKKIGKKVALIGAGPASLACARELAIAGVDTTIFEKQVEYLDMVSLLQDFRTG